MSQRNMSITATTATRGARHQSASGPPTQEFVTVAVLPPRLPADVAPPTDLGPADVFSWDESVNWRHNEKIDKPEDKPTGAKKWIKKAGLTTKRKSASDKPPFIMRQVPYDVWRKHYAKDKDGRFQGTGTPAEDCLLLPEDVEKWRFGPAETKGDQWTRGKAALPVYADADTGAEVPEYSKDAPPIEPRAMSTSSAGSQPNQSTYTADGKTAEQIIEEARARHEAQKNGKGNWKQVLKKGTERALLAA